MSLGEWVFAVLLSLPISKHDRSVDAEEKHAQTKVIAAAIAEAAEGARWAGPRKELAALMIVTAHFESGFALHIHAGNCRPHECDGGRARGLWQQQARSASSLEAWERLAGLDAESTRFAAREAARALVRARGQCRSYEREGGDWASMAISAYAGRGCLRGFRGHPARVATLKRVLAL